MPREALSEAEEEPTPESRELRLDSLECEDFPLVLEV